jgi:hypothetical protein
MLATPPKPHKAQQNRKRPMTSLGKTEPKKSGQ